MKRKILAYNFEFSETLDRLRDRFDVEIFERINPKTDPAFLHALEMAEGIVGLALPVDKELLDRAPNLKIISNNSTGFNNLSLDEMTKRGIMGTNTPGVLEDTTADAIFGILLAKKKTHPRIRPIRKDWKVEATSN